MGNLSEPIGPLQEGLAATHEFFINMLAVGFTESQACHIIGIMLAHAQSGTSNPRPDERR